jgi:methyl-accepting chemotaxis protein
MSIRRKLLTVILLLFTFILLVVGFNLQTYSKLKGDAPSINLAGSQRMRTFKISFYTTRYVVTGSLDYKELVETEIAQFEKITTGLTQGDR